MLDAVDPFDKAHWTIEPGVLRIAIYPGFPPFAWMESDGLRGMDPAVLRGFANRHGMQVKIVRHAFHGIWELPGKGLADVAASGLTVRRDRSAHGMAWSQVYGRVRRAALVRPDSRSLLGSGKFRRPVRLGVVRGSAAHLHARRRLPRGSELVFCDGLREGVHELLDRRLDALGTGTASACHLAEQHPLQAVELDMGTGFDEQLAYAVRDHPGLRSALDAYLAQRMAVSGLTSTSRTSCGEFLWAGDGI
jgi:ABC-type amino acid transport substrate-binding protein